MQTSQEKIHQQSLSLDTEVNRLSGQNKDLKDGYQLMRDQLRSEQLSSENMSTLNRRLHEQLEILEFDVERGRSARELEGTMVYNFCWLRMMLSCAMLWCPVLFYGVLCYAMVSCAILCCHVMCCTALYCTALYCNVLYSVVLHCP